MTRDRDTNRSGSGVPVKGMRQIKIKGPGGEGEGIRRGPITGVRSDPEPASDRFLEEGVEHWLPHREVRGKESFRRRTDEDAA